VCEVTAYDASGGSEVQSVTTSVDDTIGGTFTLSLGASTTTALANDITAADMLIALNLLTGLGSGVAVTREATATAGCFSWRITFTDLGNIAELGAVSTLSGTNAAVSVQTTQEGGGGSITYEVEFQAWNPSSAESENNIFHHEVNVALHWSGAHNKTKPPTIEGQPCSDCGGGGRCTFARTGALVAHMMVVILVQTLPLTSDTRLLLL
jgi:hypothetical protein